MAAAYVAPFLPAPVTWPAALFNLVLPSWSLGHLTDRPSVPLEKHPTQGCKRTAENDSSILSTAKLAKLSIIIPVYNEGRKNLLQMVEDLYSKAQEPNEMEIVLVDAGCKDDTFQGDISEFQNRAPGSKIIIGSSNSGRGYALRSGAALASGDLFLFVHTDCALPIGFDRSIRSSLVRKEVLMTAFSFGVNRVQPSLSSFSSQRNVCGELVRNDAVELVESEKFEKGLQRLERLTNLRANWLWLPYGDQSLGFRKEDYYLLGGFPAVRMMEDFALVSKARAQALKNGLKIYIHPDQALCSPRRWEKNGILANSLRNWGFVAAYVFLGMSPDTIFEKYYSS